MILYFADRQMTILGTASTNLLQGFIISDDLTMEDVDSGITALECTVDYTLAEQETVTDITSVGNYILRQRDDETEFYVIIDHEKDTAEQQIRIYAENAGIDLLNEIATAFTADAAHPIEWYVQKWTYDTGFEIGINEIPDLTRKLSWDGEATCAERLASVATQFDNAEISYSFAIEGLRITHKYINIHERRGKAEGRQLRLNREVDQIIIKTNIANLCTSLVATGGTPSGKDKPITLSGYSYDDGDFYVSGSRLNSRKALETWSRYVRPDEPYQTNSVGHIVGTYKYETTSQSELCARTKTELAKRCVPEVNYEITTAVWDQNNKVGDTVNVIDESGKLYLQTRILALESSETRQEYKATFGEYLLRSSGISEEVRILASQFAELAASRPFYTWIVYADDDEGTNISLDPDGKAYMGVANNKTVIDPDISDPSLYQWSRVKGEDGEAGPQGLPAKLYGTCVTPADTSAKVVVCENFELYEGITISILFDHENATDNTTLNVSDTGDVPVYANGETLTANGPYSWTENDTIDFLYDGTNWIMDTALVSAVDADNSAQAAQDTADSVHDDIHGSAFYQYTNNGTTYEVGYNGSDKTYYYYNDSGTLVTIDYASLDGDTIYRYVDPNTDEAYEVFYDVTNDEYYYYVEEEGQQVIHTVIYDQLEQEDGVAVTNFVPYTIVKGGLQETVNSVVDSVEKIEGSIVIDNEEPSITIQTVEKSSTATTVGSASLKLTSKRLAFNRSGNDGEEKEVAYIDSEESDGVLDINNARINESLRIGDLEFFNYNDGIAVRRWK